MIKKALLSTLLICLIAFIGIWYYVIYKPTHNKRSVINEQGIKISAAAIVKAYQVNEQVANVAYLNKTLEVFGEITEIKLDQTGITTVELKSNDAFAGVFCSLKKLDNHLKVGQQITIKGICTGFLTDVVLIEAIIVN
jgi:preprotein translocase subunit YajC